MLAGCAEGCIVTNCARGNGYVASTSAGNSSKGLAMSPGVENHKGFEHLSRIIIAVVLPELLATLPPPAHQGAGFSHLGHQLARVMKDHGHVSYLRRYVLQDAPLSEVPMGGIQLSIRDTHDPEEQRLLLRRALAVASESRAPPLEGALNGLRPVSRLRKGTAACRRASRLV